MLQKIKNRDGAEGFTIIEVLIVLAIAGLILLIVFLAVPALQRSSRNTQRKNDASAISSAVANFIDNNGGTLPASVGGTSPSLLICGSSCTGNTETAHLGFYDPANVSTQTSATLPTADTNKVVIVLDDTCNSTNTGVNAANSNSRSAAIVYWTENGTSTPPTQCVEQ